MRARAINIAMIIMLMIGLNACMDYGYHPDREEMPGNIHPQADIEWQEKAENETGREAEKMDLDSRMLAYINDRYDDVFTIYERTAGNLKGTERRIAVKSEKYPKEYITVVYRNDDGDEFFNDDYLYYHYREQTIETLQKVLAEAIAYDFKVFFDGPPAVDTRTIPADATFDEYIADSASRVGFTAVVSPGYDIGVPGSLEEKLIGAFRQRRMVITNAIIRFCRDEGTYRMLDRSILTAFETSDTEPRLRIYGISAEDAELVWR